MSYKVAQLRKWLVGIAVVLSLVVVVSYYVARFRVKPQLHSVPQQLGLDIQQTSEGFTLSKSEGGRTIYTIRASSTVQFKKGGHADLKNVHIVVYGKAHDRYDQIYGREFTYDPESGDVNGIGEVHIDLQGYAEGPTKPDQAPPDELKNPVHIVTRSLSFNQKTGQAHTDDEVQFRTLQASGSARGAYYDANTNQLQLKSDVQIITTGDNAADISGSSATIQKDPRQAVLFGAAIYQTDRTLTADLLTMVFEPDNTIQHATAEGNVNIEVRGDTIVDISGPHGVLNMGPQNAIQQAIVSGGAKYNTRGDNLSHGSADTFIMDFEADNQPKYFHMVKNARMRQEPQPGKPGSPGQPMEIVADNLDFVLENGNELKTADTAGKAQITIFPAPPGAKTARSAPKPGQDLGSANATTIATAGKFHATFGPDNRMQTLHGSPEARIVSTSPGEPDKISISQILDVTFAPDGGAEKLVQSGDFQYHEPSLKPDTGGRAMFADKAAYTPIDQVLILNGSPRVIDNGTTTTADVIRLNRQTGEAFADGNVKTTYSDLKPQPGGALLASSDPVHVTALHMTSRQQPGVAHYSGNVRLWQTNNVVRAPLMDFDQQNRTIIAHADTLQSVSSLFVEQERDGKLSPVDVTADRLTYVDGDRRARYTGNVLAKSTDGSIGAEQIDAYLKPADTANPAPAKSAQSPFPGAEGPSKIDHMVAIGNVVVTEPNRRAVGDRLVYTADDGKYYLTGKTASIFDAEHGTAWGDSLTFYSRDDRVLVESKHTPPTVTRARITK
ncbi:MAG TPA: LPS export ABC transporter periplasmic protein LptC [Candidatus Eisenbacteria bacterium]|nr:LPS export ABC transporter periplasmic protein LptC [Candidatus Eisenbacteria bacterium]